MKRFLFFLAAALMACTMALAEAAITPLPPTQELNVDFTQLTPDPEATPVPVDPIDKPTPTPVPIPNYVYDTYVNEAMGVSFSIPYTWLLNPNTNLETTVQFVEPQSEMMDVGGYQTRLTIEKLNMGLQQTAADARERLEYVLEELEQSFTVFSANSVAPQSVGDANGYYCYYKAEYNDGVKNYLMNGRIIIVAHGKALYQIRLTTPRNWYSYYEYVYRKVRSTMEFL